MGAGIGKGIGFPSTGSSTGGGQPGADAPTITDVVYKENAGGEIKFEIGMSDGGKIPFNIPESAIPGNANEVSATLGHGQDPRSMAAGKYYVTEAFVGAPTLEGTDFVGPLEIDDNYDGANGSIIKYFNSEGLFTLTKYAGGWDTEWSEFKKWTIPELTNFQMWATWARNTTVPEVGDKMTMSAQHPSPAGASTTGIVWSVDKDSVQAGKVTVSGNVITLLKPSIGFNITGTAPNGVSVTGSYSIAETGQGNAAPPVIPSNADLAKQLSDMQKEIDALKAGTRTAEIPLQPSHTAAPNPEFEPKTEVLNGGFTDDWGDVVTFSHSAAGRPLTITKTESQAQYAVLSMAKGEASHVSGIKVDGGLPSQWESKVVTIQGVTHTMFKSPFKFTKSPLTIEVVWS